MNDYRKKIIITGGTSGIGKAAAMELAKEHVEIVLTGSHTLKGEKAVSDIKKVTGNEFVSFMSCDLSSFKYVKSFVTRIKSKWDQLDVLVNNAGVVKKDRQLTDNGFEYTFQVNYLSHYLLTLSLLGMLKKSKDGRIINVSSRMEKFSQLNLNDVNLEKKYNPVVAYANSKQAQLLFTYAMAEKYPELSVNALHPGGVFTGLYNYSPIVNILSYLYRPFMISPKKGAETLVYLATADDVKGISGKYFIKNKESKSSPHSYNKEQIKALWEMSNKAVGLQKETIKKRQNAVKSKKELNPKIEQSSKKELNPKKEANSKKATTSKPKSSKTTKTAQDKTKKKEDIKPNKQA